MSPEVADACIMEFTFRWNQVASRNHKGEPDYGFFSLEILDEVQVSYVHLHSRRFKLCLQGGGRQVT